MSARGGVIHRTVEAEVAVNVDELLNDPAVRDRLADPDLRDLLRAIETRVWLPAEWAQLQESLGRACVMGQRRQRAAGGSA